MPYGEKLKLIKKNRGLTNKAIHELCEVPLSTVTRMFDDETLSGNFETFVSLAKGLNFSLDELAGLKQPDKSSDDLTQLLKEKDVKIEQLTEQIKNLHDDYKTLREDNNSLRKDNQSLRRGKFIIIGILVVLVTALFAYIIYDLLNGHLGVIRY